MQHVLHEVRLSFTFTQALVLALLLAGGAAQGAAQVATAETVDQKATEQFETSPLKTTSLDKGLFMFSGDGGNVTAIVDDGTTLLIDSGVDSRIAELSDAVFKATLRPVTRLVNTHWHFDHTRGERILRLRRRDDHCARRRKNTDVVRAERAPRRLTRWPLSVTGTPNSNLFKQYDVASRFAAADIGPLRSCAHGRRHSYLYRSGEHRGGRRHFSNHVYPIIDLASGGSIDGMIHSLDLILAQTDEQTKIVPGHGPVATRRDLQDYRDMLAQVRQRIKGQILAGKTMGEAVASAPTKDFDATWGSGYVSPDVFTEIVFSSLTNITNASQ